MKSPAGLYHGYTRLECCYWKREADRSVFQEAAQTSPQAALKAQVY